MEWIADARLRISEERISSWCPVRVSAQVLLKLLDAVVNWICEACQLMSRTCYIEACRFRVPSLALLAFERTFACLCRYSTS